MGTFMNCRRCGEKVEVVLNQTRKKMLLNIEPYILVDKKTGAILHARTSHFMTCSKKNKSGSDTLIIKNQKIGTAAPLAGS